MTYYTTLEQSKKLIELGLNPNTADMYWKRYFILNHKEKWTPRIINQLPILLDDDDIIPCWSLGALLDVLKTRKDCNFITTHSSYSLKWRFNTSYYELANWKEKEIIGDTPIEAAYNMVCWLLENGYIKKGK